MRTEAAERRPLDHWNQKSGKNLDKLTFSVIESAALEDLDNFFVNRLPSGIRTSEMEMFRNVK